MDRLIYKEADGDLTCRSRDFEKVFPTLYAYEETGLTPEQAKALKDNLDSMIEVARDLSDTLKQAKTELESIKKEDTVKDLQLHLMADERNIAQKERDRLAELWAQVPATIKTQVIRICEGEFAKDNNVPSKAVDKTEG